MLEMMYISLVFFTLGTKYMSFGCASFVEPPNSVN